MGRNTLFGKLARSLPIAIGLVLIWRGIWYFADELDILVFAGNHFVTGVGGFLLGLFLLYYPDKDFKEIERL